MGSNWDSKWRRRRSIALSCGAASVSASSDSVADSSAEAECVGDGGGEGSTTAAATRLRFLSGRSVEVGIADGGGVIVGLLVVVKRLVVVREDVRVCVEKISRVFFKVFDVASSIGARLPLENGARG